MDSYLGARRGFSRIPLRMVLRVVSSVRSLSLLRLALGVVLRTLLGSFEANVEFLHVVVDESDFVV